MKYTFPIHLLKHKLIKRRLAGFGNDEIENFFLSHPLPYSIKAIKDFFLSAGIKSIGYKLPKEKAKEISCPFIAQFNNPSEFVLVNRVTNNEFIINTSKETNKKVSDDTFFSRWSGIVLSFDIERKMLPSTRWADKEYISNRLDAILIAFLLMLVIYPVYKAVNHFEFSSLSIITLVGIGLYSCNILLRLENGNKSQFEEKICYANSKFDCYEVIKSKISHPLGLISLAELGFFLFSFFCILLLSFSVFAEDVSVSTNLISLSCLLISPFSLGLMLYQIIKIKKICPFCSIIQLSIILNSIPSLYSSFDFSIIKRENISLTVFSFLLALCLTIILIIYYSREIQKREIIRYHSLKHTKIVIESLLQQNPLQHINDTGIVFRSRIGNPEIIFALNPKCKHCYMAFLEYKHLLDTMPNVGLGILFIVHSDTINEVGGFIEMVEEKYRSNDSSWLFMIDKWYSDTSFRRQHSNKPFNETGLGRYVKWSLENNIIASPTLVFNNRFWPQELSIIDLSDYLRSNFS